MAEKKQIGPRHGKSYGRCMKCNEEFKLRRNTKHSRNKVIKAMCSKCGGVGVVRKEEKGEEKKGEESKSS